MCLSILGEITRSAWFEWNATWLALILLGLAANRRRQWLQERVSGPIYKRLRSLSSIRKWTFWLALWSLATLNSTVYAFACKSVGFNKSLWDAFFVLAPTCALVFGYFFRHVSRNQNGCYYFFDSKHYFAYLRKPEKPKIEFLDDMDAGDSFETHSKTYSGLSKLVISFSVGASAFLINTLADEKPGAPPILGKIGDVAPIVLGFFGSSAALIILFMVLQAVWYEEYCASPKHDTYSRWKYAACLSFAWTGFAAFGIGIFWLARNLFAS
jgi:hypothetical protein